MSMPPTVVPSDARSRVRRARLDEVAMLSLGFAAGLELGLYRAEHVEECLRRALEREGAPGMSELARLVHSDPRARERFRRSVAVSVTGLFRDAGQFELLEPLLRDLPRRPNGGLAVWSAGCSNGAELVSAGILLERAAQLEGSRLLGSDVLEENVALARAGGPDPSAVPDAVRTALRFEVRDLLGPGWPAGNWSLILCRNLAIYLGSSAKERLHAALAAALAPGGVLVLGRSESLSRPGRLGLASAGPHMYRRLP
jgi:chemotaxis protein methyltransferase CheR